MLLAPANSSSNPSHITQSLLIIRMGGCHMSMSHNRW